MYLITRRPACGRLFRIRRFASLALVAALACGAERTARADSCNQGGQISYRSGQLDYCDGSQWLDMRYTKLGTCGTAGQLTMSSSIPAYCDGSTLWSIAGSKDGACADSGNFSWNGSGVSICAGGILYSANNPRHSVTMAFAAALGRAPGTLEMQSILAGLNLASAGYGDVLSLVQNMESQYPSLLAAADSTWTNRGGTWTVSALPAAYSVSANATDWLAKSVCADSSNLPVPADPYYACPAGTSLRKIQPGDPLPYYNQDLTGGTENDSFPLYDANRNPLYISTHDWAPFRAFSLNTGSDGFDVYAVKNGWVQFTETRDGGGYGTDWFDGAGKLGGFFLFPTSGFLTAGQVPATSYAGVYWEKAGYSFPGTAPTSFVSDYSIWGLQKGVQFGGVHGFPAKTMDAMVVYTGVNPDPNFVNYGHLEVFYFTQQYGVTKWEVWVPVQQSPTKTSSCSEPDDTKTLNGVTFVVANCEDWSNTVLASSPMIPLWPIPEANLLAHSHFDSGFSDSETNQGEWHRGGNSVEGNVINWGQRNSTAGLDIAYSQNNVGPAYLLTNCAGTCTGPGVQQIYQELPISSFVNNGSYLFGVDARMEPGSGPGDLVVAVQEADAAGHVLWQDSVTANLTVDNGSGRIDTIGSVSAPESSSVYLSSAFVKKVTTMPILPGATHVRYIITPTTSWVAYDVLDAWLNPFPTQSAGFGVAK